MFQSSAPPLLWVAPAPLPTHSTSLTVYVCCGHMVISVYVYCTWSLFRVVWTCLTSSLQSRHVKSSTIQDVRYHVGYSHCTSYLLPSPPPPFPTSLSTHTHTRAVSVVQQIWGKDARGSIGYFSETEDKEYSTTNIGVPNTERGVSTCVLMVTVLVHQP